MNTRLISLSACMLAALPGAAFAHGVVGNRVFPATLATEDPAVADELTLPQIEHFHDAESGGWTTTSAEFSKRITPDFALSLEGAYVSQSEAAGGGGNGFDNVAIAGKYQFYKNEAHETLLSVGADVDIGGSGSSHISAENFTTVTPSLFFGKGFGDLPDSVLWLQPLAVTGTLGVAVPLQAYRDEIDPLTSTLTREVHPDIARFGFTVQYSLPYLQQHVKDIGLKAPFSQIIPLVEFAFERPFDRGVSGRTTGTINPGFIWAGQGSQLGLEAIIPLNGDSGSGIGFIAQLHFYLDDLFPTTLGRPLWGK